MNELRAQPDNLPWKKSGANRNSYKIRDLMFWQANCIQGLSKRDVKKPLRETDGGLAPAVREHVQFRAVSDHIQSRFAAVSLELPRRPACDQEFPTIGDK
jgi:hypothetical protein